jgi:polyisoprenoid-binding protein YceI
VLFVLFVSFVRTRSCKGEFFALSRSISHKAHKEHKAHKRRVSGLTATAKQSSHSAIQNPKPEIRNSVRKMKMQQATEPMSSWTIEPRYSTVQFSIKRLFFLTVEGTFTEVSGQIRRADTDLGQTSVEVVIKVASLSTGNRKRDAHLQSADFFDAEHFPEIYFQSSKVEKGRDIDTLSVTGLLTIKGESREVKFEVMEVDSSHSPQGDEVAYYAMQTTLKRSDYGITRSRGVIGESLKVTTYIQAMREK